MKIERLDTRERTKTRELYEEVFSEDSMEFVDYYYQYKTPGNEIFAVLDEKEICGMAHVNPYILSADGRDLCGAYLVAVATRAKFRHRGIMTSLLKEIFCFLYEKREAFLYLMPASEAIYTPFDFRFFYCQTERYIVQNEGGREKKEETEFSVKEASEGQFELLCTAWNADLEENYRLFAKRTPEYLTDLQKELKAMKGRLMVISRGDQCVGAFQLIQEEETMIFEPWIREPFKKCLENILEGFLEKEALWGREKKVKIAAFQEELKDQKTKRKPWMMGRIIHLGEWITRLRSESQKVIRIQVTDTWIPQNDGYYEIVIGKEGGSAKKIQPETTCREISIADLPEFFEKENPMSKAFLNEWV